MPLGHDIENNQLLLLGSAQNLFEFGQVLWHDDPRLVGQDMQPGMNRRLDRVDLAPVAAGKHHNIAGPFLQHPIQGFWPGMDFQLPSGGPFDSGVEAGNALEVGQQVGAKRGVNVHNRIDSVVHFFLDKGGMKMARIEGHQANDRH